MKNPVLNAPRSSRNFFRVMSVVAFTGVLAATTAQASTVASSELDLNYVPSVLDMGDAQKRGNVAKYKLLAGAAITAPGTVVDGDVGANAAITVAGTEVMGRIEAGAALTGDAKHFNQVTQETFDALAKLKTLHKEGMEYVAGLVDAKVNGLSSNLPVTPSNPADPVPVEMIKDLAGQTLTSGVYYSSVSYSISGSVAHLVLDGQRMDGLASDAVWIFQTDASVVVNAGRQMQLINGAQAKNVFWLVNGAVTTGAGAAIVGNFISNTAISLGAGTTLDGRALSSKAAITAAGSVVN
ncbi:MAG: hypothetical protein ACJAWL_001436 [Motiliproteus sp.]|jgi:hypothetical protein